jgi:hypothetical protein
MTYPVRRRLINLDNGYPPVRIRKWAWFDINTHA